jgi:hypothetical protein
MKGMIVFVSAFVCFLLPLVSFACDQETALKVQAMLRDMGKWQEKSGRITFNWGSDWDQVNSQQRLGLLKTFANSDACLTGKAEKSSTTGKEGLWEKHRQSRGQITGQIASLTTA